MGIYMKCLLVNIYASLCVCVCVGACVCALHSVKSLSINSVFSIYCTKALRSRRIYPDNVAVHISLRVFVCACLFVYVCVCMCVCVCVGLLSLLCRNTDGRQVIRNLFIFDTHLQTGALVFLSHACKHTHTLFV